MVEAIKLGKGMISESWENYLKNIALLLGVLSVVAIILDWYPFTMFISLPFCMIWVYCGWLRTEPQLKWVNMIFCILYLFGIVRYFFIIWIPNFILHRVGDIPSNSHLILHRVRQPPSKIPLLDLYYFLRIFQVEPDLLGKRNDLC